MLSKILKMRNNKENEKLENVSDKEAKAPTKTIQKLPSPLVGETETLLNEVLLDDELKTPPSLLHRMAGRLRNITRRKSGTSGHLHTHEQDLHHRLEIAFEALHREFDQREKALEKKLAETAHSYQNRIKRSKLLIGSMAAVAVISLGYAFYTMQLMGSAMTSISGDITNMNKSVSSMDANVATMSTDTRQMVHSIQRMDQNMGSLNYNVGNMNYSMNAMNRNVAEMNQSIAPLGSVARPVGGMMGAMKSFMPF